VRLRAAQDLPSKPGQHGNGQLAADSVMQTITMNKPVLERAETYPSPQVWVLELQLAEL
jgi:hypothetical protein